MFELLSLPVGLVLDFTHFIFVLFFAFLNLEVQRGDCNFKAANEVRVLKRLVLISISLPLKLAEEGIALRLQLSNLEIQELNLLSEVLVLQNQQRM